MSNEVIRVLEAGVSQDPALLKHAEEKLKDWESVPGFYSSLFVIAANRQFGDSVRWLATVTIKNGIDKYWRKGAPNGIAESEKVTIRAGLLQLIGEPNTQVALQLEVVLGKIARFDAPVDWPELLPALLTILDCPEDLKQERALSNIYQLVKALASKRLAGDRRLFQTFTSEVLSKLLQVWNVFTETLIIQIRDNHETAPSNLKKCITSTKIVRKLVTQGIKEPHQNQQVMEFLELVFQRVKALLELRKHSVVGTPLLQSLEKLIVGHIKILADLLERSPFSFVPLVDRTLNFIADYVFTPEGQGYAFEEFAVKLMNLMKAIVLCAEYRPAKQVEETKEPATLEAYKIKMAFFNPAKLGQIFHRLVGDYFPLKESDLEKWSADPEDFINEDGGDSWKYALRPSTESLFLAVFHEYSSVMCALLLELVKQNTAFVSPEDIRGILKKDAVYLAIGLASFELFEEIDFDNWFSTSLLQELQCKDPNYRILRRRVIWLIGRWTSVKFATILRPAMYEVLLNLMGPQEDLVVRLEAAVTLRSAMDDFEFSVEQFMPYLQLSFNQLFQLLNEVSECDTKLQVLNVMSLMIDLVGAEIQPYVGELIQFLPALWDAAEQHDMLRCSIVSTLVHIVKGLGGLAIGLASFLVPVIGFATDVKQAAHVYLMDDALELWRTLVENSPVFSPDLFQLFENLPKVLEQSSEHLIIACHIIKAYLYICPEEFLRSYGDGLVSFFNDQIRDLRSEGVTKICGVVEQMILCSPALGPAVVKPLIPFFFNIIYEDQESPLVLASCISVGARLLLASQQSFLQAVDSLASQLNVTSESAFNRVLDVWIDRMSYFSSTEKRKLMSVALASLLTSRSALILDKICGILLRVCETIFDILTRGDDGLEIDRLYSVPGEFEPEVPGDDYECRPTEHTRRQRKFLTTMDPIHMVSLPDYFRQQVNLLRSQTTPAEFEELMKTVDVETMEMVKEFFANSNIKTSNPITNPLILNILLRLSLPPDLDLLLYPSISTTTKKLDDQNKPTKRQIHISPCEPAFKVPYELPALVLLCLDMELSKRSLANDCLSLVGTLPIANGASVAAVQISCLAMPVLDSYVRKGNH